MSDFEFNMQIVEHELLGAIVTGARIQKGEEDWDDIPIIEFTRFVRERDGSVTEYVTEVGVLRDPEGNGPGWLEIPEYDRNAIQLKRKKDPAYKPKAYLDPLSLMRARFAKAKKD
jgi:hypothetical protein